MDLMNLIRYEQGNLNDKEVIEFFSDLITTGQCWQLQGHYGRTAAALIENNWIDKNGQINSDKMDANGI